MPSRTYGDNWCCASCEPSGRGSGLGVIEENGCVCTADGDRCLWLGGETLRILCLVVLGVCLALLSASLVVVAVGCLVIGWLVGATSIGGFLVVPLLMVALGLPIGQAVVTGLISFVPAGAIAAYLYYRTERMDVRLGVILGVAALPGIWMGIWLGSWMSERAAEVALSGLLVVLGAYVGYQVVHARKAVAVRVREGREADTAGPDGGEEARVVPAWRTRRGVVSLGIASLVAGAAASLAGVGGALILVPLMVALQINPAVAIGTGLLSSWLAAIFTSLSRLFVTPLDIGVVVLVALAYTGGVLAGEKSARRVRGETMRGAIAVICFLAAVAVVVK